MSTPAPNRLENRAHRSRLPLRAALFASTALIPLCIATLPSLAGPQGGQVVSGQASISTPGPNQTRIDQSSQRAIIDWRNFSIGAGERVDFRQPGRDSISLNRVTGPDASSIQGNLTANGQVWLVNPHGVMFGAGARVDVGGLMATTSNIRNEDFMFGRYLFNEGSSDPNARVINRGTIRVGEHGYAALSAAAVENSGTVEAQLGTVVLGGAKAFAIDLHGDRLLSYQVTQPVDRAPDGAAALVTNSGTLKADGGSVLLTARAAKGVIDNVINTNGVIEARSAQSINGQIVIDGGDANVVTASGKLDASGLNAGETGGTVKLLGERVGLMDGGTIDVSGDRGGGTALIGGNYQGRGPETNSKRTYVAPTARINADAVTQGKGGRVIVWSDGETAYAGKITARGGRQGGDGGFAEVSGKQNLIYRGTADLTATLGIMGTLLLDPMDLIIATGGGDPVSGYSLFADVPAATANIDPAVIITALDGANVMLQANNDIVVNNNIDATGNAGNGNLTLQAGRTISFNADVLLKGNFSATANDPGTDGANRSPGAGSISMGAGTTIDTSATNGTITLISAAPGGNNPTPGFVAFSNLTSGTGAITLTANGGQVSQNVATSITQTPGAGALTVTTVGANNISITETSNTITGSLVLSTATGSATVANGFVGGTVLGATGVGGALDVTSVAGSITQTGALTVGGNATFTANAAPTQTVVLMDPTNSFGGTVTVDNNTPLGTVVIWAPTLSLGQIQTQGPLAIRTDTLTATTAGSFVDALMIEPLTVSRNIIYGTGGGALVVSTTNLSDLGPTTAFGLGRPDGTGTVTWNAGTTPTAPTTVITNSGNITFSSALTLGSGLDALSTTGNIAFSNTVNGAQALMVATGGTTTFSSPIGGVTPLTSLNLATAVGTITLGNVTTIGTQSYGGAVALDAAATLTTTNSNVTFNSTIDASTPGVESLTVNAGNGTLTLGGAVGGTNALATFNSTGTTSATTITNVTTTGAQSYGGAVTLSAATTLATTSSNIAFASTVDGAQNLTLAAGAGSLSFGGAVGGTTPLTQLDATGSTGTISLSNVTTTGNQLYGGAVTLAGATTLTTTNSNVTFQSTVDGAQALTLAAGNGTVGFTGAVGGATALTSITATGTGNTNFSADVTTTGAQSYGGPMNLIGTVATGGGAFSVAGPVNMTGNATINTGGGNITLNTVTGLTETLTLNAGTTGTIVDGATNALQVQALSVQAGNATLTGTINGQSGAAAAAATTYVAGGAGPFTMNGVSYAPVSPPPSPPSSPPSSPPVTVSPPVSPPVTVSPPVSPPPSPPVTVSPPPSPPPGTITIGDTVITVASVEAVLTSNSTPPQSTTTPSTNNPVVQETFQTMSLALADTGDTTQQASTGDTGGGTTTGGTTTGGGTSGDGTTQSAGGGANDGGGSINPSSGTETAGSSSTVVVPGLLTRTTPARPAATPPGQSPLNQAFPSLGNASLWR